MRIILLLTTFTFISCATSLKTTTTTEQKIIDQTINAHGGKNYESAHYTFEFRQKEYSFKHEDARFEYTSAQDKNDRDVRYFLSNDKFEKTINGEVLNLSDKDVVKNSDALNSVIYFALLPYRLNDPAVIKSYKGLSKIKGQTYHTIEVRFSDENGGTDHEDIYYYWINEETHTMDYLAYNFHVNGGGVRFRSAYNARMVEGIRFQDYENYSAAVNTSLSELPVLYENGDLKLLSKIELENVKKVN